MEKLIAIKNLFSINLSNIWIALDDIESEGIWKWKWDYLNTTKIFPNNHNLWAPGEPDNLDKTHDCVEMEEIPYYSYMDIYGHIRLHDVSCYRNQTVICESLVARTQLEQNDYHSGSNNAFKPGNLIFLLSVTSILQGWLQKM